MPCDPAVPTVPQGRRAPEQASADERSARIRRHRAGRRRDHVRLPRRGVPPGDRVQGRRRNHHRQAA
ncbi:hypothetical protein G6F60_015419 [Rhizopus arrhizus]|nr:hypothetical protein G6F60_015419 [Rhizopus arrhizus]